MAEASCSTCRFWRRGHYGCDITDRGVREWGSEHSGECRRFPAKVVTGENDGCLEYEQVTELAPLMPCCRPVAKPVKSTDPTGEPLDASDLKGFATVLLLVAIVTAVLYWIA